MDEKEPVNFEKAFLRLEEILEKMNGGRTTLDEALKLYEEADTLITICSKKLSEAERKIEMLIKKREGDLALDPNGIPQVEIFSV